MYRSMIVLISLICTSTQANVVVVQATEPEMNLDCQILDGRQRAACFIQTYHLYYNVIGKPIDTKHIKQRVISCVGQKSISNCFKDHGMTAPRSVYQKLSTAIQQPDQFMENRCNSRTCRRAFAKNIALRAQKIDFGISHLVPFQCNKYLKLSDSRGLLTCLNHQLAAGRNITQMWRGE